MPIQVTVEQYLAAQSRNYILYQDSIIELGSLTMWLDNIK